jgi:hypothetical protein
MGEYQLNVENFMQQHDGDFIFAGWRPRCGYG